MIRVHSKSHGFRAIIDSEPEPRMGELVAGNTGPLFWGTFRDGRRDPFTPFPTKSQEATPKTPRRLRALGLLGLIGFRVE